jgi:hypothetical protein
MNDTDLKQALKEIIICSDNSQVAKKIIDDIRNWNRFQHQPDPLHTQ